MNTNLILNTDSYKASHFLQYPPDTEFISSYIESRGGKYYEAVFFGLQAFLKEYLTKPIIKENIEEAKEFLHLHGLPFNQEGWEYILKKHGGYLPLEIEAIPEGSIIPVHNVMLQIINTDPKCYWLTSYIETALLRAIWYPTTVATNSWYCKRVIRKYLMETSGSLSDLEFKLHDFGARGTSSFETAYLGGMAHLLNFRGSDTISGVLAAREYYGEEMAASSIPAAEHSTIVTWGKEKEVEAYRHILCRFAGKNKSVAIVSDSYDLWNALEKVLGEQLHEEVKNNAGTLVIRPDSGEPIAVVTGAIEMLMAKFGYTINTKGYKVLPDYIRVIQGDGTSLESIKKILMEMRDRKQSAENITFGMGAALLQKFNRDTMRFAMKASSICVKGEWKDISKSPITDLKKQSKKGRLALIKHKDKFRTINFNDLDSHENQLKKVYRNGKLLIEYTFQEIRDKVEAFTKAYDSTKG